MKCNNIHFIEVLEWEESEQEARERWQKENKQKQK